ncbi:hypothetical protein [Pedobacter punctiformis]|uniref:DUF4783 domain-containing protein n=1 Tax=Pedobacter punctiformis TaxID=3004097 RepID=A0ABT4L5U0_9SPHI|nr:hypothetical protein [Pedobacter sp. HCMS5-2]MCZ4243286.1 hypothetical protein [Pedobacter sp. HCMS5-2]
MGRLLFCFFITLSLTTQAQIKPGKNQMALDLTKLSNTKVKAAVVALQKGESKSWFALCAADAILYDDGNQMQFNNFFKKALGHERFTSIDKVENNGLDVYGHFHSDQWGDFKTYFKFKFNKEGKISRLDIGQASY